MRPDGEQTNGRRTARIVLITISAACSITAGILHAQTNDEQQRQRDRQIQQIQYQQCLDEHRNDDPLYDAYGTPATDDPMSDLDCFLESPTP